MLHRFLVSFLYLHAQLHSIYVPFVLQVFHITSACFQWISLRIIGQVITVYLIMALAVLHTIFCAYYSPMKIGLSFDFHI
jgi:hypothetical protein